MKCKFSTNSNRVKGLSFHPTRPWIIASLHSGVIQIWDFKIKTLIAKFQEHQGPVRAISFHPSSPLFVSGGDDTFVKVWNYKQRKCLFTLKGHVDYIRTAFFHNELPWILTACDDQTMRIWNYNSRTCINIITGHSHYVMCAQFHPEKNFIVSCSLDATVRLWDFTVLRKKLTESKESIAFTGIQIECIKVLEGHERGVNWVCFHPLEGYNFIASAADDRKIKLWKYTTEVAWENATIQGHSHNVSCVIFDPVTGLLISNSEDKTIRTWNIETKAQVDCFKKKTEREWILAVQNSGQLLASGHDEGFDILTLNKEKLPHILLDTTTLIYAQGMQVFMVDLKTKAEKKQLYQYVPKDANATFRIKKLLSNPFESSYYLAKIEEGARKQFSLKKKQIHLTYPVLLKTFEALDVCFVNDKVMAVLTSPNQIDFMTLSAADNRVKVLKLATPIKALFSLTSGVLLIVTNTLIVKFNFDTSKSLAQLEIEEDLKVKQVISAGDNIAVLAKNKLLILDEDLTLLAQIKEQFRVKSAFWERQNLLFYTTTNHWKYALMNGETGILKSLEDSLHLVKKVTNTKYLAFSAKKKIFQVECPAYHELEFKLSLYQKDWPTVQKAVKQLPRKGKALIGYLVEREYSSIALEMVTEPRERFSLAINSSQFQLAYDICSKINSPDLWKILGEEALKQGIFNVVEVAYQKLQQYDKMSFLYLIQGNTQKLNKMLKLSQKLNDPMARFNNALMAENSAERVQLLKETGNVELAKLSANAYGLSGDNSDSQLLKRLGSRPLNFCRPVETDFSNWPHNQIEDEYLLSLREQE